MNEGLIKTAAGITVLKHDSHLSRWIEIDGRLDHARFEIDKFKQFIPKGGVVIDAGASLGDHAITYAELVGEKGSVMAFEPNELPFLALVQNMAALPQVHPVMLALSNVEQTCSIQTNLNAGMAHLIPASEYKQQIRCVTIDDYLANLERLDFIHLDVEGNETKAIEGGRKLIAKFKPAIVLEVNHECLARVGLTETDVLVLLDDMNYDWKELEPHHGTHLTQRDILAFPRK